MGKGFFIVFEGGEGTGKSTQAKLLADRLSKNNYAVLLTKEPGGDDGICRDIRKVLLNSDYKDVFSSRAELFLFEADRAQHVERVIRPALAAGKIVISDRYQASTFAYQVAARGVCRPDDFFHLNGIATGRLDPHFTFLIDLDPEIGLQRNIAVQKRDRFELEDVDFHRKVRQGLLEYFGNHRGNDWEMIDGSQSIEEIHRLIINTSFIRTKLQAC